MRARLIPREQKKRPLKRAHMYVGRAVRIVSQRDFIMLLFIIIILACDRQPAKSRRGSKYCFARFLRQLYTFDCVPFVFRSTSRRCTFD